jgi:hypothetical protein
LDGVSDGGAVHEGHELDVEVGEVRHQVLLGGAGRRKVGYAQQMTAGGPYGLYGYDEDGAPMWDDCPGCGYAPGSREDGLCSACAAEAEGGEAEAQPTINAED